MEHRWGRRLVAATPVRLRCMGSPDSGCRCLGRLENVSASGALIRTELGICPSATIVVETLSTAPDVMRREFPACVVRNSPGELAIEWSDFASTEVFELLADTLLDCGRGEGEIPELGRVRFCALSPAMFA